ncbi:MAG: hypothetical protein C0404_00200 [Verrucomicrobia bacterium]|nr:hypothetical protein [Verrucomicrobiota bacterium]
MENTSQPQGEQQGAAGQGKPSGAAPAPEKHPMKAKNPVRKVLHRSVVMPKVDYAAWVTGIKWKRIVWVYALSIPLAAILFIIGWQKHERSVVRTIPILMYHQVGSNVTDSAWCVLPEDFRSQMSMMRKRGYQAILPSDLVANRKWGKPLPVNCMIITFDDGYRDTLKLVEPVLKEYDFKAVAYLVTSAVSEDRNKPGTYEEKTCITWPEVAEMQKRGTIVFGGHSHEHRNLAVEGDPFPLINESKAQLEKHGISGDLSFCYPHGQYKQETIDAVKRAGFTTAVVCEDRKAVVGRTTDLLALPRISVMGGKHEFIVNRHMETEPADAVIFSVKFDGVPMEISPAMRGLKGEMQWQLPRELKQGENEIRWTVTNPKMDKEHVSIDIWDKHRLFRMFSGRIKMVMPL